VGLDRRECDGIQLLNPIYLDYNATTPLDPGVVAAMEPVLRRHFGNPSSAHDYGRPAREALAHARRQVGLLLGAEPGEIVVTGSGSESTNLALKGLVFAALRGAAIEDLHVVTSAVEHPATLETCRFLERLGCRVTTVRVDRHGVIDLDALRAALSRPTLAVSVMHANNEVGTLQPIRQIAELASRGFPRVAGPPPAQPTGWVSGAWSGLFDAGDRPAEAGQFAGGGDGDDGAAFRASLESCPGAV
jgi:cysteine sulfinate desulfinase/cysteine desulfurase-like protein